MKKVTLTTDGACQGNPGPGGWAALLQFGTKEKMVSGGEAHTTNNRMELQAVISGLATLKEACDVLIVSDSKYIVDAFEKKWIDGWQERGWKTASREPVKNQDLWEDLLNEIERHKIRWKWVRGHNGHIENERVDEEAVRQASLYARRGPRNAE